MEEPGTEGTGSGAGADPGDTPDGWRWTKLGDGGILKRQIPMDEVEDIQISYILTDLNVEVTDSEEILLEEEYVVPWEEIHQTRVSSGGGRVEIVNDDPDGSKGTIVLGLTGLRFEDEERKGSRFPPGSRSQRISGRAGDQYGIGKHTDSEI